jgi:hypothetical protein
LGNGAHGKTYKVRDKATGKDFACKLFSMEGKDVEKAHLSWARETNTLLRFKGERYFEEIVEHYFEP